MNGNASALDTGKLFLELLRGRVDHQGTGFLEDQVLNFHETVEFTLANGAGEDFVDLPLIQKHDFKQTHGDGVKVWCGLEPMGGIEPPTY